MGTGVRIPRPSVSRRIDAPAATVWRILTDLDQWPLWGPSVRHAELAGGARELGRGVRGTVWTAIGIPMPFEITEFDPGRRWNWSVAGVPATGHEVIPVGDCCIARFEVPRWAVPYLTVCSIALSRIADQVSQQ